MKADAIQVGISITSYAAMFSMSVSTAPTCIQVLPTKAAEWAAGALANIVSQRLNTFLDSFVADSQAVVSCYSVALRIRACSAGNSSCTGLFVMACTVILWRLMILHS